MMNNSGWNQIDDEGVPFLNNFPALQVLDLQ